MVSQWTTRAALLSVGALAAWWAVHCLPIAGDQSLFEQTAKRIYAREKFRLDVLSGLGAREQGLRELKWERPSVLSAKAAIGLRRLEIAMENPAGGEADRLLAENETAIRYALSNVPTDSFLWVVYFWIENNRFGFRPSHLNYLNMSYETGLNEGWVAVSRSRFALALFAALPAPAAEIAVTEFRRLVASGFYEASVDLLSRQGDQLATRLLGSLASVNLDVRQNFSRIARRQGFEWKVPGIDAMEWRPWHR